MRLLLTGTSGQVGAALRPLLLRDVELLTPQRAQFDLANPETLTAALDELTPDLIINPAAYSAVDRAEEEADLAFRVNATAPAVLARWSAEHNAPLIHYSTDYVFDGTGDKPWREDDAAAPLSVYGASKLAGEKAIQSTGCSHLIVRTSWVYASEGTNFLKTIARSARERKELRVVADQIGAPTSAKAIANAVVRILQSNKLDLGEAFKKSGGLINIACAGETSWHGFATAIVNGLKSRGVKLEVEALIPIGTKEYPTRAARPGNSRLELSRLRDLFGIVTPSWIEALAVELDELTHLTKLDS